MSRRPSALPRSALTAVLALALGACAGGSPALSPDPAPHGTHAASPGHMDAPGEVDLAGEAPRTAEPTAPSAHRTGVLLMAHGGSDTWNEGVDAVARHLDAHLPTSLAFGMANPMTLQAGMDSLAREGVNRVAVVRMFLSGNSFRTQTEYLLGLSETPPPFFIRHGEGHGHHGTPAPVDHAMTLVTHDHGLMQAPEAAGILRERARALSVNPAGESVLVLAHGMGDDAENRRVLDAMTAAAPGLEEMGFATVQVEALREDWPEERAQAEDRIRAFMTREAAAGREVIVLPFRLFGFGPYAEVLEGFDYRAGDGLLPHAGVEAWALRTARELICGSGWDAGDLSCARPATVTASEQAGH